MFSRKNVSIILTLTLLISPLAAYANNPSQKAPTKTDQSETQEEKGFTLKDIVLGVTSFIAVTASTILLYKLYQEKYASVSVGAINGKLNDLGQSFNNLKRQTANPKVAQAFEERLGQMPTIVAALSDEELLQNIQQNPAILLAFLNSEDVRRELGAALNDINARAPGSVDMLVNEAMQSQKLAQDTGAFIKNELYPTLLKSREFRRLLYSWLNKADRVVQHGSRILSAI